MGLWMRGNENIASFGIRTKGIPRNIHTTIFNDSGALYCEVSDYVDGTPESKEVVWLSDRPLILSDVEALFEDIFEEMTEDYDEDDEYEEMNIPWARYADDLDFEDRRVADFDIIPLLEGIMREDLFKPRRIIDSYNEGMPGIARTDESFKMLLPFTDAQLLSIEFSKNNPLFRELPFFEGIEKMFNHLGETGVLEEYYKLHPPDINKMQAAIMNVLSQSKKH